MEVGGLEISPEANQVARERFGLDLYQGDFETMDMRAEAGRWDIVFAGDVFEHFPHPAVVVDKVHEMLAPGGVAFIVVPGTFNLFSTAIARNLYRLLGRQQRLTDLPYHLFEYTSDSARAMWARRFARVEIRNHIKPASAVNRKGGSLAFQVKYLLHLLNVPFTRMTGRRGDRITIIAHKD